MNYNADEAYRSHKVQQAILGLHHDQKMEAWRAFRKSFRHGWSKIEEYKQINKPHDLDISHGKEI